MALRKVKAIRYIQPLREGGSLPVLVEADDARKYVVKLRGAGQGVLALAAEILGGEIGRSLGLRVPEIVLVDLDMAFGKNEPDAEIQQLFKASTGWNVGLEFVAEATVFDAAAGDIASTEEASLTVWMDSFVLNIDRTAKNANLLLRKQEMWLIDHGAALYFHHNWPGAYEKATSRFEAIRNHILLRWASGIPAAAGKARSTLTAAELRRIVELVPEDLLVAAGDEAVGGEMRRDAYLDFFARRMNAARLFEEEIDRARSEVV